MTKTTRSIYSAVALLGLAVFAVAASLVTVDHVNAALPLQATANTHSLELIGQIGGSFKALVAQNEYVFAAIGPRLAVLDVADAAHPTLRGQTGVLPIDIQGLAIQGNRVYAAAGTDGLFIFDVSNPSQPVQMGSLGIPGFATRVAIKGTHVFVTTDTGLQIVDVSLSSALQAVGSYPGTISDIAFNGNTMFVALGDKISILDISNPATPSLIVNYNVPADEIEIDGNLVYVGKPGQVPGPAGNIYYGILRILDISGLPSITELFFSGDGYPGNVPSQLWEMKLLDNKLYGYSFSCGRPSGPCSLEFGDVDVSNPISPTLEYTSLYHVYTYDAYWGDFGNFAVFGQQVYMATRDTLHVFNAGTGAEMGQYNSWIADKVSVANGVAYVAARSSGLLTMDVSAPEHPMVMDAYTTTVEGGGMQPARISNMVVYGPYIYVEVVASGFGLSRVDILDVSRSVDIQRVATREWYMIPIRIHNGYGYYFNWGFGNQLRGIDLGNPTQPIDTLGSVATTISGPQLSLVGSYAYVAGEYEGLRIININNPQNFVGVKRLDGPIPAFLMDSTDEALYFFTDQALKIYDLSDPENPVESSNTPLPNLVGLKAIKVSDGYVYLIQNESTTIHYTSTVRAFYTPGLTSPASEVAFYTRPGSFFTSIDVVGDLVYVASTEDGLLILHQVISTPTLSAKIYLPFVVNQVSSPPANCTITYRTYMQNNGWLNWASDGHESGMAGQGLRVEALQVNACATMPESLGIVYQAHVQDIGWMDWVYDGQIAGITGQGKRLEAVRFKLLNAPDGYHITYRVFVEGNGWTESVSDGAIAGTTGQSKRVEAIQINLVQP